MNRTKIEYLTHTWNPIAMRCDPVSEGCKNCWHLAICKRQAANPILSDEVRDAKAGGEPILLDKELKAPLRLKQPARIGVQFMGDLFHDDVPFEFINKVFCVMQDCPQHTFQVLTKRAKRTCRYMQATTPRLPNVWLGVTAENQKAADERVSILRDCPAAVRFVSVEPLLGPVDLRFGDNMKSGEDSGVGCYPCENGGIRHQHYISEPCGRGIDWVIIGCESGSKRRPCKLEWVRDLVQQCQAASVPVFVKQLDLGTRVSQDPDDWPEDLRVREYPA
ncbi:unnamed protein product [marine sediment metagenome]|uniref:Phage protein Gp37/Gp68 n=1 Tax=marine sediment metagenome TaxID=412755 RepID=X0S5G4_9ZZZZ